MLDDNNVNFNVSHQMTRPLSIFYVFYINIEFESVLTWFNATISQ